MGEVALLWLFLSGVLVVCAVAALITLGLGLTLGWLVRFLAVRSWTVLGGVVRGGRRFAQVSGLRVRRRASQAGGVRAVLGPVTGGAAVGGLDGVTGAGGGRTPAGGVRGVAVVPGEPGQIDKPGRHRLVSESDRTGRPEGQR